MFREELMVWWRIVKVLRTLGDTTFSRIQAGRLMAVRSVNNFFSRSGLWKLTLGTQRH